MDASLDSKPIKIKVPQIISNVAVKYAQNAGSLNPIFKNRPVPNNSGNKYFWIPSDRNISPTIKRIIIARLSFTVLSMRVENVFLDFMAE